MYVSRPVRAIRDDPDAGDTVRLRLSAPDAVDSVRDAAEAVDGARVESESRVGTLVVEVPEERVADICDIDDLAAVETANVLGVDIGDAGEDVEPG